MKKVIPLFVFLFILPLVNAQCIEPTDGQIITSNTIFCGSSISLTNPLILNQDDITIQCEDTQFTCSTSQQGFIIQGRTGVQVSGCQIQNCQIGFHLIDSSANTLSNNEISNANIAIALESSPDNNIQNNIFSANNVNIEQLDVPPVPTLFEETQPEPELISQPPPTEPIPFSITIQTVIIQPTQQDAIEILSEHIIQSDPDAENIQQKVQEILNQQFSSTKDVIINKTIIKKEGETIIRIELIPLKPLQSFSLYEKIPKCFANYVSELINLTPNYKVITEDPLMVWEFDELITKKKIQYGIDTPVLDSCLPLFITLGITKPRIIFNSGISYGKLLLMGVIVLIIAGGTIYFSRFKKE